MTNAAQYINTSPWLAIVVVFGLTTSTLLTLFVVPAVYGWFAGTKLPEPDEK